MQSLTLLAAMRVMYPSCISSIVLSDVPQQIILQLSEGGRNYTYDIAFVELRNVLTVIEDIRKLREAQGYAASPLG